MHVAYLGAIMSIYPTCKAQMALLLAEEVSGPKEYADFFNVFSKKSVIVLPKRLDINKPAINLEPGY